MPVNTQQLLASVVSKPISSAVDAKYMASIWDSFVTHMTEQLHENVPLRCLHLGDFCLRKDTIGRMDFYNPMFVVSPTFAAKHGLHDRRPKPAALESVVHGTGPPADLDLNVVTRGASDRLGEVVMRETVEAALRDVVDRLGEMCADDKTHGIVTVDLLLGKLVCENRSIEFHFLSKDERSRALDRKRRTAAKKGASGALSDAGTMPASTATDVGAGVGAGDHELSLVGAAAPGTAGPRGVPAASGGRRSDPPLQRPRRPFYRKADKVGPRDVLVSHAEQISRKAQDAEEEHKLEARQFAEDMARLRGEMVQEMEDRISRRGHLRDVALIHQVQAHEKALRDRDARTLDGPSYFPFRTEEEVDAQKQRSNKLLRANLDCQLKEKEAARDAERAGSARARGELGAADSTSLPMRAPDDIPPADLDGKPHRALQAAIDEAYQRYSSFLETRAGAEEHAQAFRAEQAYLSEQAELLRREEARRRTEDMASYLKKQMEQKELREKQTQLEHRAYKPVQSIMLPPPKMRDPEREAETRDQLRAALDTQVEQKRAAREAAEQADLEQQAEMLALVSHELREARMRDVVRKQDEQAVLREAWDRQKVLKQLEKQTAP